MIFNAELQQETEHELVVDQNNEILATCLETGRFLKFPNVPEVVFDEYVAEHKAHNEGQVNIEELFEGELVEAEVTDSLVDESVNELVPTDQ